MLPRNSIHSLLDEIKQTQEYSLQSIAESECDSSVYSENSHGTQGTLLPEVHLDRSVLDDLLATARVELQLDQETASHSPSPSRPASAVSNHSHTSTSQPH